jgi:two-component system response regulator
MNANRMTDDRERDVILLVEDTLADQELVLHELLAHGVTNEVVVAESGDEALDYLFGTGRSVGRDVTEQPLVLLLDLNLPGVNGIDVLRRVRADTRTKTLPVIVLTRSAEETALIGSYALAASSRKSH